MNGKELKQIRKRTGLNQSEFGAKMNLSLKTISNYELGLAEIPQDTQDLVRYKFPRESNLVITRRRMNASDFNFQPLESDMKDEMIVLLREQLQDKERYIKSLEKLIAIHEGAVK